MEVGVIRFEDIALVGIPEPDHLRRAHVGVLERHDDVALAIDWRIPADKVILSEKDKCHPLLKDAEWLFDYNDNLYE